MLEVLGVLGLFVKDVGQHLSQEGAVGLAVQAGQVKHLWHVKEEVIVDDGGKGVWREEVLLSRRVGKKWSDNFSIVLKQPTKETVTHHSLLVRGHSQKDHEDSSMHIPHHLLHVQRQASSLLFTPERKERGEGWRSHIYTRAKFNAMETAKKSVVQKGTGLPWTKP